MGIKKTFSNIILVFVCAILMASLSSCSTSKKETKSTATYQKKRTRHQPNWNHTTSQTTTYYIRKHNTHKSHNR